MKEYKKVKENLQYTILNAVVLVNCICGHDIYVDHDEPVSCSVCGRKYGATITAYQYIEKE